MKNFNKLFGGILLAFGLMMIASVNSKASVVARMPKEVFVSSYTTGLVQITPAVSTPIANNAFQPGAVYQVVLSSGANGEYFQMYDSTGSVGITCASGGGPAQTALTTHLFFSSTSANTNFVFDPPLMFHNGLTVCDSAATGQAAVTYELGRGLSGQ